MAGKKSIEPSPESIARDNRRRAAAEDGQRAMADVEREAIAIRKNMERLRALRQAREAEAAAAAPAAGDAKAKVRGKARAPA